MAVCVLDVLDAALRSNEKLAQSRLALDQWMLAQILAIEGKKIETERQGGGVIAPVTQQVELRDALTVETDNLGVDDRMTFDPRRLLDNAGIAFRPVSPVHCVEAHPAVTDVNL